MSDYTDLYNRIAEELMKPKRGRHGYMNSESGRYIAADRVYKRIKPLAALEAAFAKELAKAYMRAVGRDEADLPPDIQSDDLGFSDEVSDFTVAMRMHKSETRLSIPNLIGVEDLLKLYEHPNDYFVLALLDYEMTIEPEQGWGEMEAQLEDVTISDIEHISWKSLGLSENDKGQLQIKVGSKLELDPANNRQSWLRELHKRLVGYYDAEVKKSIKKLEQAQRRLAELERGA